MRRDAGAGAVDGGAGAAFPRIARRRALPTGRALFGALLITAAALGAFALANRNRDAGTANYVVATRPIAPGARIERSALERRTLRLDPTVAAGAFVDADRLAGAVALGPIGAGSLIQSSAVALATTADGAPLAGHEFTFPVPKDRVPPSLKRGEKVAVLATYGSGSDTRTITTVQQAVVVAFDADGDAIGTRSTARLTLSLPDANAVVETAHASQVADLTIVRTSFASAPLPTGYRPAPATTVKGS